MLEELINKFVPPLVNILELMGVIIVVIGAVTAFYRYMKSVFTKTKYSIKYTFANNLAMGLEFKLAGEILKTVLIRSIDELWIIAAVSLLRGFLAVLIYWEMKNEKSEESSYDSTKKESSSSSNKSSNSNSKSTSLTK